MDVDRSQLDAVLRLLLESKRLHEGGWMEAHLKANEAIRLLQRLLHEGGANAKSTE